MRKKIAKKSVPADPGRVVICVAVSKEVNEELQAVAHKNVRNRTDQVRYFIKEGLESERDA